ncbi:IS6 family transposase [Legionella bozemanae]|uniref:IS6 family transposase n=1 Tax=Legionella bozemanae TaxID=447 RepID=UPI00104116BE|nr:IS6 family transposase [Legionella bozemanae]
MIPLFRCWHLSDLVLLIPNVLWYLKNKDVIKYALPTVMFWRGLSLSYSNLLELSDERGLELAGFNLYRVSDYYRKNQLEKLTPKKLVVKNQLTMKKIEHKIKKKWLYLLVDSKEIVYDFFFLETPSDEIAKQFFEQSLDLNGLPPKINSLILDLPKKFQAKYDDL